MKKEYADKWITALRSGRYPQTTNWLRNEKGFCCLGVLCDLVKDEVDGKWKILNPEANVDRSFYKDNEKNAEFSNVEVLPSYVEVLPSYVMELTGMKSNIGSFSIESFSKDSLANLNDNFKNFTEIANVIEKNWEQL